MVANTKPLLRGALHQWAAWYALGAGSVLMLFADTSREIAAAAIYSASLVALFTVSAVYHRVQWSEAARALMRRADHSSIFILIAGTYTPIAMLGLGYDDGRRLLLVIWLGAAAGVVLSLVWVRAPKGLVAALAVALGWTIVPYFGEVRRLLGAQVWLILGGGLLYTAGALVYALRRPDPWPRTFGYHEVFHALTVAGALLHFGVIVRVIRDSPAL